MPTAECALPIISLWRCTGCGSCEQECPTHAVAVLGGKAQIVRPADCTFCAVCEERCPEGAIGRPYGVFFAANSKQH